MKRALHSVSLSLVLVAVGCSGTSPEASPEVSTSYGDLTATSVVEIGTIRSTLVDRTGQVLATLVLTESPRRGVWTGANGVTRDLNLVNPSDAPSAPSAKRTDVDSWPTNGAEANAVVHTLNSLLSTSERGYNAGCSTWNTGSQYCMECHDSDYSCFACEDGYSHCANF